MKMGIKKYRRSLDSFVCFRTGSNVGPLWTWWWN